MSDEMSCFEPPMFERKQTTCVAKHVHCELLHAEMWSRNSHLQFNIKVACDLSGFSGRGLPCRLLGAI